MGMARARARAPGYKRLKRLHQALNSSAEQRKTGGRAHLDIFCLCVHVIGVVVAEYAHV